MKVHITFDEPTRGCRPIYRRERFLIRESEIRLLFTASTCTITDLQNQNASVLLKELWVEDNSPFVNT